MESTEKKFPSLIYDLLIEKANAPKSYKEDFINDFISSSCKEFRFQGKFGFGGKFRFKKNRIDFYREDETAELVKLQEEINLEIENLALDHLFIKNDYDHMHDCILHCTWNGEKFKPTKDEMKQIFHKLTSPLKEEAYEFGMNDTLWRDNFINWYTLNNTNK